MRGRVGVGEIARCFVGARRRFPSPLALSRRRERGSDCRAGVAPSRHVATVTERGILKLHILGIAGTFMGGVAALARELRDTVEGSDQAVYPPMSTQLEQLGIALRQGYSPDNISPDCDAIAGTHGKTTTTTILTYLLEAAGREPGFLIGGVAEDFGVSARVGRGRDFVEEADEYDTAFFDKRSKFVHYRPTVAILNNLEFDHADIFPDVAAIQRQFHHLVRTVPRRGRLIVNGEDQHLAEVLAMGCWTPVETFGLDASLAPRFASTQLHGDRGNDASAASAAFHWTARLLSEDGSAFVVVHEGREIGEVRWPLLGRHNVMNALAALASVNAVGVDPASVLSSLSSFRSVKRRLEVIGEAAGVTVYDDFAHHPTAIATTLAGLRAKVGEARIVVAVEPRSNSMRLGAHADALAPSLDGADVVVFLHRPELAWDAGHVVGALRGEGVTAPDADALIEALRGRVRAGDHVVFMSNGGFDGAPRRFYAALQG